MRQLAVLATVGALLAGTGSSAQAGVVAVGASQDSYITVHPGLGGSTSVHGGDGTIYSISEFQPPNVSDYFDCFPFIAFDLSAYAGQTVQSAGSLTLNVWQAAGVTQTYAVVRVGDAWSEGSLVWNNQPGGSFLSTQTVFASGGTLVTLSISTSTLQDWIDHPGTNFGLEFVPTSFSVSAHSDIIYYSRESGLGPTLRFDVAAVPLPPAVWSGVALLSVVGLVGAWRRRAAALVEV